jgi:four helix bundle protein
MADPAASPSNPSASGASSPGSGQGPQSYRDLHVWKQGLDLVVRVYRLSLKFPEGERHGLRADLRRTALRIPTAIARGWGRQDQAAYLAALHEAHGLLIELETLLLVAHELDFVLEEDLHETIDLLVPLRDVVLALTHMITKVE